MENLLGLADFIRTLGARQLGASLLYFVPEGKTYTETTNALTATAARHKVKISTSQALLCEEGKQIIAVIRVTRK